MRILLITVSDKPFFSAKLQGSANKPVNSKGILEVA